MTTVSSSTGTTQGSSTFNTSSLMQSLGMGSGIDIKALAQNLVDATSQPRSAMIQKNIDKQNARKSAYDVITKSITQIQDDLRVLSQPATFSQFKIDNTNSSAVSVTASLGAQAGSHTIHVTQTAQAQRSVIRGTSGQPMIAGSQISALPFTVEIQLNGQSQNIVISDTTPEGIVQAINDRGLAVKASLMNLTGVQGGELAIVLNGDVGESNQFTFSSNLANLSIEQNRVAQNAIFTVDGIALSRSKNNVTDVIPGAVIQLLSPTSSNDVIVSLSNDTTSVKNAMQNLMNSYNELQNIIDVASDPNSTVDTLGGSLIGDQSIRMVRDKVRAIIMPATGSSNSGFQVSGSSSLEGLRNLGLIIDADGRMKYAHLAESDPNNQLYKIGNDTTFNQQLTQNTKEVQALLQGADGKLGIATDMANALVGMGSYADSNAVPSSPMTILLTLKNGANNRIKDEQRRLADLQLRMQSLLDRYMQQFSVMENLVGQNKATMKNLEASFASMNQK